MVKQYAQALFELSQDIPNLNAGQADIGLDTLIQKFIGMLERKRHMRLLPAIVHHFERYLARRERHQTIELIVAKDSDIEHYSQMLARHPDMLDLSDAGYGKERPRDKKVIIKTDSAIIGGYVIQSAVARVDASYRKYLLDLYKDLVSEPTL